MNLNWKKISIWVGIIAVALLLVYALFLYFNRNAAPAPATGASFGQAGQNTATSGAGSGSGGNTPLNVGASGGTASPSAQTVFLIADGPVAAATLLEEGAPSITNARYITADDGHVLDLPLDVPGAAPKIVSQTTIPGIKRALFTDRGQGVLMQYLEGSTIKTVHLAFQTINQSTSTPTAPPASAEATVGTQVIVQFLPDNIEDLAVSPDGSRIVYLLHAGAGLAGYASSSDGTRAKKLFTLSLSQIAIFWPAQNNIVAYSKSAAGVPGIVFSINAKTGSVSPLLYGQGIIAAADQSFAHLLYQINNGGSSLSYIDILKTGASAPLASFSVNPEQCAAGNEQPAAGDQLYCAAPANAEGGTFVDLWHQGRASAPDNLISLNPASGTTTLIAEPGNGSGGENSDIIGVAVSPLGNYLSFVNKSNGRLWGVRLATSH